MAKHPSKVLRMPALKESLGLRSSTTVYKLVNEGDFPKPVKLTNRAIGWIASEVDEWLASRERVTTPTEASREPATVAETRGVEDKLIGITIACQLAGISRSTLRTKLNSGDFPPPRRLGARRLVWKYSEITNWRTKQPKF